MNAVKHERKNNPKRLNNPTATHNNPKQLMHRVYALQCLFVTCRRREHKWRQNTAQKKPNLLNNPILTSNKQQHSADEISMTFEEIESGEGGRKNKHNDG